MTVDVYNMKSAVNKIGKDYTLITTLTGNLKNDCGRTSPRILIEADMENLKKANYMYIPAFGRYYFINEITSIRDNICEIKGTVDVLESFKTDILNTNVILKRQRDNWNLYVNDGSFISYENDKMYNINFPSGITGGTYALFTM